MEIDRFFIKEKLDDGIIKISYVTSSEQIADCLTKGLGNKECSSACNKMGMIDIYHPSRGGVLETALGGLEYSSEC